MYFIPVIYLSGLWLRGEREQVFSNQEDAKRAALSLLFLRRALYDGRVAGPSDNEMFVFSFEDRFASLWFESNDNIFNQYCTPRLVWNNFEWREIHEVL